MEVVVVGGGLGGSLLAACVCWESAVEIMIVSGVHEGFTRTHSKPGTYYAGTSRKGRKRTTTQAHTWKIIAPSPGTGTAQYTAAAFRFMLRAGTTREKRKRKRMP